MKILIVILITTLAHFGNPDYYYVTRVKGVAFKTGSKQPLKTGDSVLLSEQLQFQSYADYVIVVHPTKGRFVIVKDQPASTPINSKILVFINENIKPANTVKIMAGRAGGINGLVDLKVHINANAIADTFRAVLADSFVVKLNATAFPSSGNDFFYLSYPFNGETINKKLSFQKNKDGDNTVNLVIDRQVFSINGKFVVPQGLLYATLFYMRNSQPQEVGGIQIVAPAHTDYRKEIILLRRNLVNYYKGRDNISRLVENDINQYVLEQYSNAYQ
jgi:hypothetical protein